MNWLKLIALVSTVATSACAPVQILNTITPTGSYSKTKNISYGPIDRQKLDVYRADVPKTGAPLIVFVHGGSWQDGSKNIYKFLAEGFTQKGYDVVVPNYRLYPEAVYPVMIEDTAKAVAFVQQEFLDRDLVLMGHSAGAYNILMTMLDPEYLSAVNGDLCTRIAGAVSLAGPTGILAVGIEPYTTIFPERLFGSDAPLNNVSAPTPPVFFGHGLDDATVDPENSRRLAEKMKARGGVIVLKTYAEMSHTDPVKVLSRHFDGKVSLKADIIEFIDGLPRQDNFCR